MPRVSAVSGAWTDKRVGLLHQRLERAHAFHADAELGAVGHVGVVDDDAELEGLGAERRRRADAAQAHDAEGLHAVSPEQRILQVAPRRGLRPALRLEVERDAAAERQGQGQRVVGHLGGAVVRHVAHHHLALGRGGAIDLVVAHAHAHDAGEPGEFGQVLGGHRMTQHHQAVDLGAVACLELRQVGDVAPLHAHVGPEHLALDLVVVVQLLRVEHRLDHGLVVSSVMRGILGPIPIGCHRTTSLLFCRARASPERVIVFRTASLRLAHDARASRRLAVRKSMKTRQQITWRALATQYNL